MNPLQKYPHLFANEKYKIHYKDKVWILDVLDLSGNMLGISNNTGEIWAKSKECTLIARPINDMTYEETRKYPMVEGFTKRNTDECKNIRKHIIDDIKMEALNSKCMIYLLSIGVYPFDQSHFDDGTVVDSTTL